MCCVCLVSHLCLTLCVLIDCSQSGSSVPGDSLGPGVGCHAHIHTYIYVYICVCVYIYIYTHTYDSLCCLCEITTIFYINYTTLYYNLKKMTIPNVSKGVRQLKVSYVLSICTYVIAQWFSYFVNFCQFFIN